MFKNKKQKQLSSVITSAALQDHIMRKYNYNLNCDIKNEPIRQKIKDKKLPSIKTSLDHQIIKLQKQQQTSILPYKNEILKNLKQQKINTQKMKIYNKKLTWAQKIGIVQLPPHPLTTKQWLKIEEQSRKRNDSDNVCSICLQGFKIQLQVILSCTHVFHKQCLNSYEKHNKIRCCPICRRKDYEIKIIDEAIRVFTMKSIIRIQRVFRGSITRIRLYTQLVDKQYKATSIRFNRRLIGFKMWKLSNQIVQKAKKNSKKYDLMIENMRKQHEKTKQNLLNQIVEVQRVKMHNEDQIDKYLQIYGIKQVKKDISEKDWQSIKQKGLVRQEKQCSICLTALWNKSVYLLSCSHMFHVNCIDSFERYAVRGNEYKCPCCRNLYSKKLLKILNK